MSLRMNEHNNGYMAMARYTVRTAEVNAGAAPDLNEAFFVKRERPPDDPLRRSGRRFVGPNVWPDGHRLPGFRETVLAYTDAMDRFGRRMLRAVAAALDLAPHWFDSAFEESQFSFRLSHYPPVTAGENQFGIAPHTDVNFMTFLPQSEVPGLEVLTPSGEWAPVPEIPDSFAVNSGDTLHRWTNGRFRSTAHRARPPIGTHRYAIPFFLGPHVDTLIECLPTCLDEGSEPRFPPMTYGDYLDWWYTENYPPERRTRTESGGVLPSRPRCAADPAPASIARSAQTSPALRSKGVQACVFRNRPTQSICCRVAIRRPVPTC